MANTFPELHLDAKDIQPVIRNITKIIIESVLTPIVNEIRKKAEVKGDMEIPVLQDILPALESAKEKFPSITFTLVIDGRYSEDMPRTGKYIQVKPLKIMDGSVVTGTEGRNRPYYNLAGHYNILYKDTDGRHPIQVEYSPNDGPANNYEPLAQFFSNPVILVSGDNQNLALNYLAEKIGGIRTQKADKLISGLSKGEQIPHKVLLEFAKKHLSDLVAKSRDLLEDEIAEIKDSYGDPLLRNEAVNILINKLLKMGFTNVKVGLLRDGETLVNIHSRSQISVVHVEELYREDPNNTYGSLVPSDRPRYLVNEQPLNYSDETLNYVIEWEPRRFSSYWRLPEGLDPDKLSAFIVISEAKIVEAIVKGVKTQLVEFMSSDRKKGKKKS